MSYVSFRKSKGNFEVNVSYNKGGKSHYTNIVDRDPNKFAQILMDLYLELGGSIENGAKLFLKRIKKKDWLGI